MRMMTTTSRRNTTHPRLRGWMVASSPDRGAGADSAGADFSVVMRILHRRAGGRRACLQGSHIPEGRENAEAPDRGVRGFGEEVLRERSAVALLLDLGLL